MSATMTQSEALRTLKKIRQDMANTARELRLEAAWARDVAAMDLAIRALDDQSTWLSLMQAEHSEIGRDLLPA